MVEGKSGGLLRVLLSEVLPHFPSGMVVAPIGRRALRKVLETRQEAVIGDMTISFPEGEVCFEMGNEKILFHYDELYRAL